MHYLVYQITNLLNGKQYIGAHKTYNKDDGYMGSGTILKRAVKKYGLENFRKEILFEASSAEEMFTKEKELVVLGPQSYNLKEGGYGGWDHVSHLPEEMKRIQELGVIASDYGKLGGEANRKKWLADIEYAAKMRKFQSEGGRIGGLIGFKGKHHTEEAKEKIRKANSANQSGKGNSQYGKVRTQEEKARISASLREYHKRKLFQGSTEVDAPHC